MSVDVDIPHLGDCRSRRYSHGPHGSNELLVIVEDGQPIHFEIALWFNHFHGVRRVLPDSASIYVSRGTPKFTFLIVTSLMSTGAFLALQLRKRIALPKGSSTTMPTSWIRPDIVFFGERPLHI